VQVTVNGQPIDYTLEGERLLGDVVGSIEKWLNGARMVVTSLRLGDRELASVPEPSWARLPIDGLARLDITACSPAELEREQITVIGSYLEQLEAAFRGGGALPAGTLASVVDFASTMRRLLDLSAGSPAEKALGELERLLAGGTPDAVHAWPQGIRERALGAVETLRHALRVRSVEIERPAEALRSTADELGESARDLPEVSLLLQTGRDEKAMATIGRFSELLQSVLRAVARLGPAASAGGTLVEGRRVEDFVGDLNGVLKQAIEALESRDSVLLGDLLEYEVAPRAASLSRSLRRPEAPSS